MAAHRVLVIQHRVLLRKTLTPVMEQHQDRATLPLRKRRKTLRDSTPPPPLKVRKSYNICAFLDQSSKSVFLTDETPLQTNNKISSILRILLLSIPSLLRRPRSKDPVRRPRHSIWQARRFLLRSRITRRETRLRVFPVVASRRLNLFGKWP